MLLTALARMEAMMMVPMLFAHRAILNVLPVQQMQLIVKVALKPDYQLQHAHVRMENLTMKLMLLVYPVQ